MSARAVVAAPLFFAGVSCADPVVVERGSGADELGAALAKAGVTVTRRGDEIAVDAADVARAVSVARGVLPPETGREPLVPTLAKERATASRETERRLEATLRALPGVVGARVHLDLPAAGPLDEPKPPSAAVLLLGGDDVAAASARRIVAGAVSGLAIDRVTAETAPVTATLAQSFARVGPFRVPASDATLLRGTLAGLLATSLGLAGLLVASKAQRRRST